MLVAFNSGRETQSLRLIVAVTDFADTRVLSKNVEVTVPAGATIRQKLELGTGKRGFFRVTLECEEGAVIPSRAERFAVIERCTDSDGLFGMNHAYPWATLNALSKKIGLTWFRDWSLKWLHVEPEPGQFDFTETDYQINRVLELGINVLPLLPFPSNNWASTAPLDVGTQGGYPSNRERAAYMPRDLTEFANYVRTTVTRYRDRLHVWEILNEPIYTSYALPASKGYTVRDYVQLLEVAYRAIKETDPQAVVIGGIAGPPGHFTKDFIDAGGLKWVDALNLHAYPGLHTPEGYVKELRKLIEQMKAAEGVRPIWLTEGAYYADDDPPWEPYTFSWMTLVDNEALCAAYQVRFDALLLAHGTQKIIYHSGTSGSLNREAVEGIFFEWDGAPRKMAATQAQLTALLGPNTKPLGVLSEEPWICAFHSRGKTVAIIWDTSPGNRHLAPLKGAQLLDLCGNPVTESVPLGETPYYVVFDREVSRDYVQRALL
ncbi:MAG: endo-1,4-beta-xylanase [Candidatus Zipacnadales bacterium]